MKKIEILIIGHICIDHNTSEKSSYISAGGSAIFINKIFNQFKDCKTTVIASYGKDFLPYLNKIKIFPARSMYNHTLIYKNIIKNELRVQKTLYRKNASPIKIKNKVGNIIKQADILFIAPLLPNFSPKYIQQIVSFTKKKSVKILLPQGYFRNFNSQNNVTKREFLEANKVLPLLNFIIVSEEDFPQMRKVGHAWVRKNNNTVIITLGKKGALIINKNKEINIPTIPVAANKIVDSIGSGDIFSAGFAYKYMKTKNIKTAVKFANKLAYKHLFYSSNEIKSISSPYNFPSTRFC